MTTAGSPSVDMDAGNTVTTLQDGDYSVVDRSGTAKRITAVNLKSDFLGDGLAAIKALTPAADNGVYFTGATTAALFDLTAAGRDMAGAADVAAQRTLLGLGGLALLNILDEDDFATDSDTRPPSQQSVKAYVDAQDIGVGQTWQDMTSSRTENTVYQNTTGKPIQVYVRSTGTTTNLDLEVSVDGSTGWVAVGSYSAEDSGSPIIPDNHYYRANGSSGTIYWAELR